MASSPANSHAAGVVDEIYEAVLLPQGWERILTALLEDMGAHRGRYLIRGALPYTPLFCATAERIVRLRLERAPERGLQHKSGGGEEAPRRGAVSEAGVARPDGSAHGLSQRDGAKPDAADPPAAEIRILDGQLDGSLAVWCEGSGARNRLAGRLRELEPHLRRAARIHWSILLAKAQANAGLFSLDILHSAAIVVGRAGAVHCANANARRLLDAKDLIVLRQGRLTTAAKEHQGRLATMLAKAIDQRQSGALKLYHAQGQGDVAIVTLPLPLRMDSEISGPLPFGLVLIWKLRRRTRPSAELLRALFSLSAAEAELAITLAAGTTLEAHCRERGIRISTARSQLRALFGKTGTNRQADLVRLIGCLPSDPADVGH